MTRQELVVVQADALRRVRRVGEDTRVPEILGVGGMKFCRSRLAT